MEAFSRVTRQILEWLQAKSRPQTALETEFAPGSGASPEKIRFPAPAETGLESEPELAKIRTLRDEVKTRIQADPVAASELLRNWFTENVSDIERKGVIVLLSLGVELAAQLLHLLPQNVIERIVIVIATAGRISKDEQAAALCDFQAAFSSRSLTGPATLQTARRLLKQALDPETAGRLSKKLDDQLNAGPFGFLQGRNPDEIRLLIDSEHPQAIAVVLAHLPPDLAASFVSVLEPGRRAELVRRLATTGPIDNETLNDIASWLESRIGTSPVRRDMPGQAADLLRESARPIAASVIEQIDQKAPQVAESIRQSLFSFPDILVLDDGTMTVILEATRSLNWAVALKGSSEKIRNRVFRLITSQAMKDLKSEIAKLGPLRLSEISIAQTEIAAAVLALDANERIQLPKRNLRSLDDSDRWMRAS